MAVTEENDFEQELTDDILRFERDPQGFVNYAYEWGEGELSDAPGPREWQTKVLKHIGSKLKDPKSRFQPILIAVASGHGIGKSALIGQVIHWGMSTCADCKVVVTANTDTQLRTKTAPEVGKWFRLGINKHWFKTPATSIYIADKDHEKTWRTDFVPWSKNNTEAFAGLHNKGKRIILVFDEGSAIDDKVFEVAEGALTDENTEIIWLVFGNPTRNTGRFRQCFGKLKHRWFTMHVDSRTVPGTNKEQIQKWVDDYGEDSDFVRIRVRGRFPRASSMQFIPSDLVFEAQQRESKSMLGDPLIMTLDIARGGEDNCVIRYRRGLDGRALPTKKIPGTEARDSMRLVSVVVEELNTNKPDAFFYDGTGVGGPVGDRIRQLGYKVFEVQFGAASPDPKYANMRAYMYAKLKEWLQNGGAIEDDPTLETDLTSVEYAHNKKDQLILESKEHMKSRGLASPDDGDALAMSFAFRVAPTAGPGSQGGGLKSEYDPFDENRGAG